MALNQQEHGDQNWWTLSEGWPETNRYAHAKWVFANMTGIIPYGSYVVRDDVLRVENDQLLSKLNDAFEMVLRAIKETEI